MEKAYRLIVTGKRGTAPIEHWFDNVNSARQFFSSVTRGGDWPEADQARIESMLTKQPRLIDSFHRRFGKWVTKRVQAKRLDYDSAFSFLTNCESGSKIWPRKNMMVTRR